SRDTRSPQRHPLSLHDALPIWTEAPPRFSCDLLMRAVAYRLQERRLGGIKLGTRRLFERVAAAAHARRPLKLAPVRKLEPGAVLDRKSTRLNSSHSQISYAVFC